jgi:endonuclease/exonuclease/phosphatase family metal-dependent hydrolase
MKIKLIIALLLSSLLCSLLISCDSTSTAETTAPETQLPATEAPADTTEEATTEEITTEAPETTEEEIKMPKTIRIGSYNIKHAADAKLNLKTIAKVITENNLDIVGIQEVDLRTKRSNGIDQPRMLAEAADMPYYVFVRGIDYQGGQYGTLILSKYPIISSEVIPLESWDKEGRALGHAVIDIEGFKFDFFNTHLSYEDKTLRGLQFAEVAEKTKACESFILTGDFNTADFTEFTVVGGNLINNAARWYPTFPGGNSAIDNIVYTDAFKEIASGTVTQSYSDHYMLWAEFEIN